MLVLCEYNLENNLLTAIGRPKRRDNIQIYSKLSSIIMENVDSVHISEK